jgi:hypothetical protein
MMSPDGEFFRAVSRRIRDALVMELASRAADSRMSSG